MTRRQSAARHLDQCHQTSRRRMMLRLPINQRLTQAGVRTRKEILEQRLPGRRGSTGFARRTSRRAKPRPLRCHRRPRRLLQKRGMCQNRRRKVAFADQIRGMRQPQPPPRNRNSAVPNPASAELVPAAINPNPTPAEQNAAPGEADAPAKNESPWQTQRNTSRKKTWGKERRRRVWRGVITSVCGLVDRAGER